MNNHCINPIYVFRKRPMDILLHIMSFVKHPISEIINIRSTAIRESIICNLEAHKTYVDNGDCSKYFSNGSDSWLNMFGDVSPNEEFFWCTYISAVISKKIKYTRTCRNIDTMLFNLKNIRNGIYGIIYDQCKYPYISELETLFEKHLSI